MSERWDEAARRRNRADIAVVRREINRYLENGYEPCCTEFEAALAAFDVFEASEGPEPDWNALEAALTRLQECTET